MVKQLLPKQRRGRSARKRENVKHVFGNPHQIGCRYAFVVGIEDHRTEIDACQVGSHPRTIKAKFENQTDHCCQTYPHAEKDRVRALPSADPFHFFYLISHFCRIIESIFYGIPYIHIGVGEFRDFIIKQSRGVDVVLVNMPMESTHDSNSLSQRRNHENEYPDQK
jgi:hypothetical protein